MFCRGQTTFSLSSPIEREMRLCHTSGKWCSLHHNHPSYELPFSTTTDLEACGLSWAVTPADFLVADENDTEPLGNLTWLEMMPQ
jgi:hypothetical protein